MISLTVYDGAHGIGGNKIYLEQSGEGVFLDFGKNFGKYGAFYEDFLKSRDTRGIHDLMHLDLLPKLNIYRPDLIPSDLSMSQFPTLKVTAVLLTHAHLDHCGNIGMLKKDIPLVASAESIAIMKGMQDTWRLLPGDGHRLFLSSPSIRKAGRPLSLICGRHELPGQGLLLHRGAIRCADLFSLPQAWTGRQESQEAGPREMLLL